MRRRLTVAVTSVRGGAAPSTGLVAAQTLRRHGAPGVTILALATDAFADGVQALHVADRVVVVPPPEGDPAGFLDVVRRLSRDVGRLVLLPGTPRDTVELARLGPALTRAGARALLPAPSHLAALPFSIRRDVLAPRHVVFGGARPARRLRWHYPVVVHWSSGVVRVVATAAELGHLLAAAPPAAVHETVAGAALSVALLALGDGPARFAVARPLAVSAEGAVWSAVTVADRALTARIARALRGLRWHGPAEARFVVDTRGRVWFTGLVPGFPTWVSLAAAAGRDLVADYVRVAAGAAPTAANGFLDGLLLSRVAVDEATTIDALRELAVEGEISHASSRV